MEMRQWEATDPDAFVTMVRARYTGGKAHIGVWIEGRKAPSNLTVAISHADTIISRLFGEDEYVESIDD